MEASTFATGFDESTFNPESSATPSYTMTHRKQMMPDQNFPPSCLERLPYHVFLITSEERFKIVVQPIIMNEATIYNVTVSQFDYK